MQLEEQWGFLFISFNYEFLVVKMMKTISVVARHGGAEEHTELSNILELMVNVEGPIEILSRTLMRNSMVVGHLYNIALLPTILDIKRNSAIRLFINLASQANFTQASYSLVHKQCGNMCVLLIRLMSMRTGEPDWDSEGNDDEENVEDENMDNIPTFVFANNQLSLLISQTGSELIYQQVHRQAFDHLDSSTEVEIYASLLGAVHLIKGFVQREVMLQLFSAN